MDGVFEKLLVCGRILVCFGLAGVGWLPSWLDGWLLG